MAAFEYAVRLGFRYLETDLHATSDGALLTFHDPTLDRVTSRHGLVSWHTYAQLSSALVHGREPIPLLEEVLAAWPQARLNIDVKHSPAIEPLAEVLRRTRAYQRICLTSFSDRRLARARSAIGRPVCTAAGPRTASRLVWAARRQPAQAHQLCGYSCVQVPQRLGGLPIVTETFVQACHGLGLQVHVWTVNDAALMRTLLELGVDGLITDEVVTLRSVLRERGQWHGWDAAE